MFDRSNSDRNEFQAAQFVAAVTGAAAEPWDIKGRRNAVDAMLHYPGGRRAALEVTSFAAEGAHQLDSLIGRTGYRWPVSGKWDWSALITGPSDYARLRKHYTDITQLCENHRVMRPAQLPREVIESDPELLWLVDESTSELIGIPDDPSDGPDYTPRFSVIATWEMARSFDGELIGLADALGDTLATPTMISHIAKLARADADERHLFVILHQNGLPPAVTAALIMGDALPHEIPQLPRGVSHLWLAAPFARVLVLTDNGWQQYSQDLMWC